MTKTEVIDEILIYANISEPEILDDFDRDALSDYLGRLVDSGGSYSDSPIPGLSIEPKVEFPPSLIAETISSEVVAKHCLTATRSHNGDFETPYRSEPLGGTSSRIESEVVVPRIVEEIPPPMDPNFKIVL